METVRLQCREEQHQQLMQVCSGNLFCPYCGLELRKQCTDSTHAVHRNRGDFFCTTCGEAIIAEAFNRKEKEKEEARKRCAESNHAGVRTVRITDDNKLECSVCGGHVPSLAQFVSQ
jgi:uncharacterized Zn finger protein (UPF0148 family)